MVSQPPIPTTPLLVEQIVKQNSRNRPFGNKNKWYWTRPLTVKHWPDLEGSRWSNPTGWPRWKTPLSEWLCRESCLENHRSKVDWNSGTRQQKGGSSRCAGFQQHQYTEKAIRLGFRRWRRRWCIVTQSQFQYSKERQFYLLDNLALMLNVKREENWLTILHEHLADWNCVILFEFGVWLIWSISPCCPRLMLQLPELQCPGCCPCDPPLAAFLALSSLGSAPSSLLSTHLARLAAKILPEHVAWLEPRIYTKKFLGVTNHFVWLEMRLWTQRNKSVRSTQSVYTPHPPRYLFGN